MSATEPFLDRWVMEHTCPFKRTQGDPVVADKDAEYVDWHHCHMSPSPYETKKTRATHNNCYKMKTCIASYEKEKGRKGDTRFPNIIKNGEDADKSELLDLHTNTCLVSELLEPKWLWGAILIANPLGQGV